MRRRTQPPTVRSLVLASLVLGGLAGAAACGDKITILECPPGTLPQGSECIPLGPDPGPPVPDAASDVGAQDLGSLPDFPTVTPDPGVGPDLPAPDQGPTPDVAGETSAGETSVGEDAGDAAGGPPQVGSACAVTQDCPAGGTCLNWPKGYCSQLDCEAGGCPEGSVCAPLGAGNTGCLATCDADADCPGAARACKPQDVVDGTRKLVCYAVEEDAGAVGATCGDSVQCGGPSVCLDTMPGGYCAVLDCAVGTCPMGSSCVKFDGGWVCLDACATTEQCDGGPGAERQCAKLKGPDGALMPVCVSGATGKAVGEACQSGFECTSGFCEILGDGRCSQTNTPCFSEADCTAVEFCSPSAFGKIGVCSAACGVGVACPGASVCVGGVGEATGSCRPVCDGPGDAAHCAADQGLTCAFGYPLGSTTGQGQYACYHAGEGAPGSACDETTTCAGGACASSTSGDGLCEAPCGVDLYCPFPTTCFVDTSTGAKSCSRACQSVADCALGQSCVAPPVGTRSACRAP